MPITTSLKNDILNGLVGRTSDFASSVYVGLSSTAPTASGTNVTEPTGNGYKRVLIGSYNQSATYKFNAASNGEVKNKDFIYFPESEGSWGATLTHFVLFSDATGDTVLGYGLLESGGVATPIKVEAEKTVVMFRPEKLVISIPDEE